MNNSDPLLSSGNETAKSVWQMYAIFLFPSHWLLNWLSILLLPALTWQMWLLRGVGCCIRLWLLWDKTVWPSLGNEQMMGRVGFARTLCMLSTTLISLLLFPFNPTIRADNTWGLRDTLGAFMIGGNTLLWPFFDGLITALCVASIWKFWRFRKHWELP